MLRGYAVRYAVRHEVARATAFRHAPTQRARGRGAASDGDLSAARVIIVAILLNGTVKGRRWKTERRRRAGGST